MSGGQPVLKSSAKDTQGRPRTQEATLDSRATSATWWSALELAARFGVQFLILAVLARLLDPSDFGLVAMVLVFTSVGALVVDSGFSTALIQRQYCTADDESSVFIFSVSTGLALSTLLWFAAPSIASFFEEPKIVSLMRVIVWVLPLGALAAVPDARLAMRLDFKTRASSELISSSCSGTIALYLAFTGCGVWTLAWQAIVGVGLRAFCLWGYTNWRPRGHFRIASLKNLFRFGSYMLLANLLDTVSTRLQSLIIGKLFDTRTLGFYNVAENTQQAPTSFFAALLSRVGLPIFSSIADSPLKLRKALSISLQLALFLFMPTMVGIAVIAGPLLTLLYGERWQTAAPMLSILALSAAFWPFHVLNLAAINALGRSDLFLWLTILKKFFLIVLVLLFSPGGAVGVASAVLANSLIALGINSHYSKTLIGYGLIAQLRDQWRTLVLSLAAATAGWLASIVATEAMVAVPAAILAAMLLYGGGAVIINHPALPQLRLFFISSSRQEGPTDGTP